MRLLRGIFELATGRARGLERFGTAPRDFWHSLYALMVLPLGSALLLLLRDGPGSAMSVLLLLICALTAPAVISHLLAVLWGREALWLRFVTAYNWSRFAIACAFAVMLLLTAILISAGMPRESAARLMVAAISLYSLWLEWFIARTGLRISGGRAALAVLAMNLGTFLLLAIPGLLAQMLSGDSALD